MSHVNAALTPRRRLIVARPVVDDGWPISEPVPSRNGTIERFQRAMADGWAYARLYRSEHERREALAAWLRHDNHTGRTPPAPTSRPARD